MANKWKKVFECMKRMEGSFFSEETDSLSNVLERDHFNRCRRERMSPRSRAIDNVQTIIIGL